MAVNQTCRITLFSLLCSARLRFIAKNAGIDGSIVVDKVKNQKGNQGFNASTEEYEDLTKAGVIDPTKVVRTALEEAVGALSAVNRRTEGELRGLASRLADAGGAEEAVPSPSADPSSPARPPLEGVVGFQAMTLARDAVCALSGRRLAPGDEAYFDVRDGDGPLVIVAPECVPRGTTEAP